MISRRRLFAGTAVFLAQLPVARSAFALVGQAAGTYYVSNQGDDNAPGTDPEHAWRTLDRVNRAQLAAGDRVLFRAGDVFAGQLRIDASGAPGQPLIFSRFGEGPKPVIDGGASPDGQRAAAIAIWNREHIEISDLEIANDVRRALPGEAQESSFGISVINSGGGVLEYFRFRNLTIRDIFSERLSHDDEEAFNRVRIAGIRLSTLDASAHREPSFLRDIVIEDCRFERSGRFGVLATHDGAGEGYRDAHVRDPETEFNRDIVICNNHFADMGGSAVLLAGARMALIDNNDFERTGSSLLPQRMVGRGSGAWVFNSRDVVAQYNRSNHVRGYKDSYGMHVDYGNRNILYQYNFSHDSEGGFVEILGNNRNIIWRYNISVNDGLRERSGNTIWLSPFSRGTIPSDDIYIYHNTVYVRPGLYPDLDFRAAGAHIWNNIFHVSREAMIGETMRVELAGGALDVQGNLFFGQVNREFRDLDEQAVRGNPQLAQPGSVTPQGYRLLAGSPAMGAGAAIRHPSFPAAGQGVLAGVSAEPRSDFFGTPIDPAMPPAIGAAITIASELQAAAAR